MVVLLYMPKIKQIKYNETLRFSVTTKYRVSLETFVSLTSIHISSGSLGGKDFKVPEYVKCSFKTCHNDTNRTWFVKTEINTQSIYSLDVPDFGSFIFKVNELLCWKNTLSRDNARHT